MNILFLSQRVPYPPNRGDKIHSFHVLQYLSRHHSVSVACLIQSDSELRYVKDLEQHCISVDAVLLNPLLSKLKSVLGVFGRKPLTLSHFYSKGLQNVIDQLVVGKKIDLIYVFSSAMAQYVLKFSDIRKIMDFTDVDSYKWLEYSQHAKFPMSTIYRMESKRMRAYEVAVTGQFDRSFVVSEPERKLLQSYVPQATVEVLSNGVNFEYFKPDDTEYEPNSVIFTGVMDYYANVDGVLYFYESILPLIQAEIPNLRFYVVGSSPVKEIRDLAEKKSIVVTGFVEDIRAYLRKAAVCVVPLRIARGIQNKVLEAMAAGVPVVTTPKAFEGIRAEPGKHLFVESTPEQFATRVVELLKQPTFRASVSKMCRELITEKYNWNTCLSDLDRVIEDLIP